MTPLAQSARSPIARCASCDWTHTTVDRTRALSALWLHDETQHRGRQAEVRQLPTVEWHEQAMKGIYQLCASGRPFVVSEVIRLGVPDAPNPRTDWPRVQREARDNGWMVPTGKLGHSIRPTAKSSPVTEWIGTAKVRGAAA